MRGQSGRVHVTEADHVRDVGQIRVGHVCADAHVFLVLLGFVVERGEIAPLEFESPEALVVAEALSCGKAQAAVHLDAVGVERVRGVGEPPADHLAESALVLGVGDVACDRLAVAGDAFVRGQALFRPCGRPQKDPDVPGVAILDPGAHVRPELGSGLRGVEMLLPHRVQDHDAGPAPLGFETAHPAIGKLLRAGVEVIDLLFQARARVVGERHLVVPGAVDWLPPPAGDAAAPRPRDVAVLVAMLQVRGQHLFAAARKGHDEPGAFPFAVNVELAVIQRGESAGESVLFVVMTRRVPFHGVPCVLPGSRCEPD